FKLVLTARSNSWDGVLESFLATCSPLNLDAQDQWGKTALRWAVELQDEATVRALLLLGANPDIKDCCGYSPRAIAKLWLTPLGDHWRAPGESNNSKNILDALEQASVDVWDASQKRLNPVSVSKTIHPALASFLTATETALISYGKNFSNPMGQKSVVALLELRRYFSVFSMELRRGGITKIFEKPIQQLIDQKFKCFFDVSQKLNSCLMKHDWIGSNEQKVDNDQTSLFVEALKRWKTGKPSKAVLSEDEAYVMEAVCFSLATSPVEDLKGNQAMLAHLLAQDDPGVGLRLINWLGVLKERAMNWSSNNPAYNFFVRNSGHRERIYRIVAAANDQLTEAESKALLKALGVEETLLPSEQSALAQASAGSPPSSDKSSTKSENYVERVIREDAERRAMEGLIDVIRFMRVSSTESGMGGRDRFISALNWLLETGKPKVDWRNPKFYEDMTSHSPLLALFSTPYVWGHLEPDEKRIILTRLYAVFSKQVHEGKTCEIEAFLPFISALEKDVLAIESSDENLGKLRFIIEQHRALAAAFPVHDMPRANSASAQKLLGQNQRAFPGELPAISDTLNGFFYLLMLQLCLRGQSIDREATFGYFFLAFQEDSLCKPASLQDLQRRLQEIPAPEPKNAKLIWAQWKRGVEPGRLAEMLLTHMRLGNLMWVHQLLLEGATPRAIDAYGENLYQVAQTAYLNVPSTMHDQKILFNQILNLVESASPIEVLLRKGKESSQQDFEEFIERKKSGYQQYPETQKVLEHMLTAIVQAMAIYLTRYEREVKTLFESSSYQAADECRRYLELMPSVLWRIKEKLLEPRVLEDILKEVAMRVEAMLKSGRNLPALIRERFQESAPAAFDGVAESKSDGDESFLDRVQNVIQMRMNNSIRRHATTATVVSSLTATPVATSSLHAARM
ncbi:MAG: ankyrin repeat domain-containing protein, partial [Gammaproteobacteria bacterium]|nr:ankyrin repeat domain-containing protein [Gammaproteobacteria bacterium]